MSAMEMDLRRMAELRADDVEYLFVHTEGAPGRGLFGNARSINDYHRAPKAKGGLGWAGIGYHQVVTRSGLVEIGRPLTKRGAHVEGMNHCSLAVCVAGNGDLQAFAPAQMDSLIRLLASLARRYRVAVPNILGHREVNDLVARGIAPIGTPKSCPGRLVSMKEIRSAVLSTIAALDASLTRPQIRGEP